MSRTLFWYVFRDLLRIFVMTSATLAGVMSFGGLLRPLTEHGLDGSQVSKMLTYFTPAMTTYSFPIAALFATTMVYGRLSADNELTACRAGGVSYLSMTAPAWVLGFTVALISLLFLCFVVPVFTLKVEQVVYSNLAQLVQNQIERTHQIKLDQFGSKPLNVYAQSAEVIPVTKEMRDQLQAERARKHLGKAQGLQCVKLTGPMIVQYTIEEPPNNKDLNNRLVVATDFSMAKHAWAYIEQQGDDVQLTVFLDDATHFARNTAGDTADQKEDNGTTRPTTQPKTKLEQDFSFRHTQFGPVQMGSPVKEDPKFMTIDTLKSMYARPETSQRLQAALVKLIKEEQASEYLKQLMATADADGSVTFRDGDGKTITLTRGELAGDMRRADNELTFQSKPRPEARQVKLTVTDPGGKSPRTTDEAIEMHIRAATQWDATDIKSDQTLDVTVEGYDVVIQSGEEEQAARHRKFGRTFYDVQMPADLARLRGNSVNYYLKSHHLSQRASKDLAQAQNKLLSKLQSEIHSRASFAMSCVVLVLIGCTLGMLFRSSNFLSAFAVSFIPAMLCIVLIVTGQQICNHATNSMAVGLTFIWSGNVLVLALALTLLVKLQRT